MDAPDARALREAWVGKYARERAPWRGPARLHPALADALLALPRGARALDVGAGGGKTLAALRALGLGAVGVDWARAEGVHVLGDARALPFRDASFAAVALAHVLQHAPRAGRRDMAREAARVVAPDGVVVGQVFDAEDRRAATGEPAGEEGSRLRGGGILSHAFTEAELGALLRASFRDVALHREVREERHLGQRMRRALIHFVARP